MARVAEGEGAEAEAAGGWEEEEEEFRALAWGAGEDGSVRSGKVEGKEAVDAAAWTFTHF